MPLIYLIFSNLHFYITVTVDFKNFEEHEKIEQRGRKAMTNRPDKKQVVGIQMQTQEILRATVAQWKHTSLPLLRYVVHTSDPLLESW